MIKKGMLANILVVTAASAAIVLVTLMSGKSSVSTLRGDWDLGEDLNFGEATVLEDAAQLSLSERDQVYFFETSEFTLSVEENGSLAVDLEKGSLMFGTQANDFSVLVDMDFARVLSAQNTAYIDLNSEEGSLELYALDRPVELQFVSEGKVLNSLLVPSKHRISVKASKVTDTLSRLRLAKLRKEFPVFSYEETDLDPTVVSVFDSLESRYKDYSVSLLGDLQARTNFGPPTSGFGATWSNWRNQIVDVLTVLPHAEENLEEQRQNRLLSYASTNLLYGDPVSAQNWLDQWSQSSVEQEQFSELNSALFFVLPGDELYPVKRLAQQGSQTLSPYQKLRLAYYDLEGLLSRGDFGQASDYFEDYQQQFIDALNSGDFETPESLAWLSREYFVVESLLKSASIFYTNEAAELLVAIESKVLSRAGAGVDLDEERQAFVQSKIAFLTELFRFVEDRSVPRDVAASLADQMLGQAMTYMDEIQTQSAVLEYFEAQLQDFELSLQFIRSPEFFSYNDFQEGLEAYQRKRADLSDLNDYLDQLRNGEGLNSEDELELSEAILEVGRRMTENSIQFSDIVPLEDSSNRLFRIEGARVSGVEFEANFDRVTGIFYGVKTGEIAFSTGIVINRLDAVLQEALKEGAVELEGPSVSPAGPEDSSLTESVAIQIVERALQSAEMNPNDFEITVLDLSKNQFSLSGELENGRVQIEAKYDASEEKLTEIKWVYLETERLFPDIGLDRFEEALKASIKAIDANQSS